MKKEKIIEGKENLKLELNVDDVTNRFASQFTRGLETISAENVYSIIISDLRKKPESEQRSISKVLRYLQKRGAGTSFTTMDLRSTARE